MLACCPSLSTQANTAEAISPKIIQTARTISTSGTYKLSNDINGQIVIAADNVTLNLNNYTITNIAHGIIINTGVNHTRIKNGSIGPITGGNGIDIQVDASHITLLEVAIDQCDRGINATTATDILIKKCTISQCTNDGIKLRRLLTVFPSCIYLYQ